MIKTPGHLYEVRQDGTIFVVPEKQKQMNYNILFNYYTKLEWRAKAKAEEFKQINEKTKAFVAAAKC